MAHPKRKISKQRRDKRRTHHKAQTPQLISCSNCGTSHEYHTICPECGYYRKQEAISEDNLLKEEN
jgi:large subunit ribosomal protein L32